MSETKREDVVFDPQSTSSRFRLWVQIKTPQGPQLLILWSRVAKVIIVAVLLLWLALAGSLWAFVKYQRGISDVQFVDVAFFPFRRAEYRATLGRHHLAQAEKQLERQAWSEALLSLRVALGNAPQNLETRRVLAEVYVMFQRPELARQVLEDGLPYAREDNAYLRQTFNFIRNQRQFERVIKLGAPLLPQKADVSLPHRTIAWQMALAYKELKKYEEAEAIVARWQLAKAHEGQSLLADIAVARGLPELAINRLKDQLQRNPKNEAIAIQLTKLYLKLGRTDEARRSALMRSFAHPESPGAHVDLLNIEWQSGNKTGFTTAAGDYLGRFASDANALLLLAILAADKAQPELATRVLATARDSSHPAALFLLALVQAQCSAGQYADALLTAAELDQEQTIPPRATNVLSSLKAWAYFGMGNEAEGDVWLQRFLTQRQLHPPDALRLAVALGNLGQEKAQVRVLLAAADLKPAADEAILALMNYYARHNAWAEAGARLPQLLAIANPPEELIQTIQWHLSQDENLPVIR